MAICSHLFSLLLSHWAAVHPPNSFLPSEDEKHNGCEHEHLLPGQRGEKKKKKKKKQQQCSVFKQTTREVAAGVATCCALCCCCPLAIVDILVLALVQAPYRFGKKSFQKLRRKSGCLLQHHTHSTKDRIQQREEEEEPLWFCEGDSAMGPSGSEDPLVISQAYVSAGGFTAGYTLTWHCGWAAPRIPHKLVQRLFSGMKKKVHFRRKNCVSSPSDCDCPTPCATSMLFSDGGDSHESTPSQSYSHRRGEDCTVGYDSDFEIEWFTEPLDSQESGGRCGFELFWDDYLNRGEVGFWRPMYSSHQD